MPFRIGVDIGGTFTDFTVVAEDGQIYLWKEDSNAAEPVSAIRDGLAAVAGELDLHVTELLSDTEMFVHGTTIATNMLIQRSGPAVGLLCTSGFRDVLHFRNAYKPHRFDVHFSHPGELVPRWLRLGVPGRIDSQGNEIVALDEAAVRSAADQFRQAEVKAVAVAFLWSMMNDSHELRAAEILRDELPGVHVLCSHAVLPEIREWERTSATVLSAYVVPGIAEYLSELETWLRDDGLARPPLIMQINGGCARVREILNRPVNILASGPAAAPAAALHYEGTTGRDVITVDMGGTSLDVCLIKGGRPAMSRDVQVEDQPIGVPAVDCHSIGAGGGSIAWIDDGGAIRVGPRSAGARPGPACYGFGGDKPTVTDVNVVLGYLAPSAFLGGRRVLQPELAEAAVAKCIAEPLGLDRIAAAAGVLRVVNANMVEAIRAVTVERGLDPRSFTLVCGGGAGGLHAAQLARDLGMSRLFVPLEAGTFCALGMTVTDVRHDHTSALHVLTDTAAISDVNTVFGTLEARAEGALAEEGFAEGRMRLERSVDARYPGQVHEITVPVPSGRRLTDEDLRALEVAFHAAHRIQFAYDRPDMPVECLHWRVAAIGETPSPQPEARSQHGGSATPTGQQLAYFGELGGMVEVPAYSAGGLATGDYLSGPSIVQAPTTTVVVRPGDRLVVEPNGFLVEVGA